MTDYTKVERIIVIVLDGVGVGAAPDADIYGDIGSNSIGNTARAIGGLHLPNMQKLGLGNLTKIQGVPACEETTGAYGKLREMSAGKDTISGHWELMGIYLQRKMPTYPNGFPPQIINEFKKRIKRDILGNVPASGTEIIKELGQIHLETGKPIVYTSADSVFQIAAHEEKIPIEELYWMCEQARQILIGEHAVARVIARPFLGTVGNFKRTERRHDYALLPPEPTVMDRLVSHGLDVFSVGKIDQIFGGRGITHSNHTTDNESSIEALKEFLTESFHGLLFCNLIEFDMIYGHRNDPTGYANALANFDRHLPEIQQAMSETDITMIVSDHGVDPTTPSTDHSREYAPLLVFGEPVKANTNLGIRSSFGDVAATIAEIFNVPSPTIGKSFCKQILKRMV